MARLMAFYQCYRAYVRGKVEGINLRTSHLAASEARQIQHEAQRYFRLALQYAVAGTGPLALIVMGPIGTGKSTLAQQLARESGWEVAASDVTRKKLAGLPLHRRTDAATRRRLYSATMTRRTYETLENRAVEYLNHGKSLIIDATFGRRRYRNQLQRQLRGRGMICFVLAEAKPKTIRDRLVQREQQMDVVSDAREEEYEVLTRMFESPTELPHEQVIRLNTDRKFEVTLSDALKQLAAINAKQSPPNS
jgi:predicted kinase